MTLAAPAEFSTLSKIRAGQIAVSYPEADSANFSTGDIKALKRLEPVIVKNARAFFLSYSGYHWMADAAASGPLLVQLFKPQPICKSPLNRWSFYVAAR